MSKSVGRSWSHEEDRVDVWILSKWFPTLQTDRKARSWLENQQFCYGECSLYEDHFLKKILSLSVPYVTSWKSEFCWDSCKPRTPVRSGGLRDPNTGLFEYQAGELSVRHSSLGILSRDWPPQVRCVKVLWGLKTNEGVNATVMKTRGSKIRMQQQMAPSTGVKIGETDLNLYSSEA